MSVTESGRQGSGGVTSGGSASTGGSRGEPSPYSFCWPDGCVPRANCATPDQGTPCTHCNTDADCPTSSICDDKVTHACFPRCESVLDCPKWLSDCVGGRCVECTRHEDCRAGNNHRICNEEHRCIDCQVDDDCFFDPARTKCNTEIGQCVECARAADCGSNQCDLNHFWCVDCNAGRSCPAPQSFDAGGAPGNAGTGSFAGGPGGYQGSGGFQQSSGMCSADGRCPCVRNEQCADSGLGPLCVNPGQPDSHCGCFGDERCETIGNCAKQACHCSPKHVCVVN